MTNKSATTTGVFDWLMAPTKIGTASPPAAISYAGLEFAFLFSLNLLELLGHLLFECPFSALNFCLILRTSILHPNLKFILICQSGCNFARGIVRILLIAFRLWTSDLSTDGPLLLLILYGYPIFFRNLLSHIMVIERVLATLLVDTYEHWRRPYFSICWFLPMSFLSLLCVGSTRSIVAEPAFLNILASTNQILGGIEIVVFSQLWKYNDQIYESIINKVHTLSQRYQLSENIRTAKQLFPTLLLHFVNISLTTFAVLMGNQRWLGHRQFVYDITLQAVFTAITFFNFLIEVSMIVCHPFLKRDLFRTWYKAKKLWSNKKIEPSCEQPNAALTMTNMRGEQIVVVDDETERHFRQLSEAWE